MADNFYIEALLEENLKAQDRTTHAVRAIASFLLIQVAWGVLAGIFAALGFFSLNSPKFALAVFIVAGVLTLVGFVHAFIRALFELDASKRADPEQLQPLGTD